MTTTRTSRPATGPLRPATTAAPVKKISSTPPVVAAATPTTTTGKRAAAPTGKGAGLVHGVSSSPSSLPPPTKMMRPAPPPQQRGPVVSSVPPDGVSKMMAVGAGRIAGGSLFSDRKSSTAGDMSDIRDCSWQTTLEPKNVAKWSVSLNETNNSGVRDSSSEPSLKVTVTPGSKWAPVIQSPPMKISFARLSGTGGAFKDSRIIGSQEYVLILSKGTPSKEFLEIYPDYEADVEEFFKLLSAANDHVSALVWSGAGWQKKKKHDLIQNAAEKMGLARTDAAVTEEAKRRFILFNNILSMSVEKSEIKTRESLDAQAMGQPGKQLYPYEDSLTLHMRAFVATNPKGGLANDAAFPVTALTTEDRVEYAASAGYTYRRVPIVDTTGHEIRIYTTNEDLDPETNQPMDPRDSPVLGRGYYVRALFSIGTTNHGQHGSHPSYGIKKIQYLNPGIPPPVVAFSDDIVSHPYVAPKDRVTVMSVASSSSSSQTVDTTTAAPMEHDDPYQHHHHQEAPEDHQTTEKDAALAEGEDTGGGFHYVSSDEQVREEEEPSSDKEEEAAE